MSAREGRRALETSSTRSQVASPRDVATESIHVYMLAAVVDGAGEESEP